MATQDQKARPAVLKRAHTPIAGLSYVRGLTDRALVILQFPRDTGSKWSSTNQLPNPSVIPSTIARVEISSLLSVQINEPPAPVSVTGRIGKVLGDRRAFDRTAPGQSGDILPARASRLIALGILDERSVDAIRPARARRRRPSESVSGGNKTNLGGPRGDRSLSQRHEAGRLIGRLRRVDRIHRRREQFNRHGKSLCQLSIYRHFRTI